MTNQTIQILEKYKRILDEYEVKDVKIVATTGIREAANRDVFLDTVSRTTGLDIDVLTVGDVVYYMDAYLSYRLMSNVKNRHPSTPSTQLLTTEIELICFKIRVENENTGKIQQGIPGMAQEED